MEKRLPASIAHRFGVALLTALMLLLSVYGYFDYRNNVRHWHTVAGNQASETLRLLALGVAYNMQETDHPAARRKLAEFVARLQTDSNAGGLLFGIREITLRDNNGNAIASYSNGNGERTANQAVFFRGRQVGTLSMSFDTSPLTPFFEHLLDSYALSLLGAVGIALLLTLLFTRWVMHALRDAIRVLPRIGNGNVALPALTARRDEYAELGRAIESADRRIHDASERLQSQQADLVLTQAELNRFKTTLDQTLDCVFMFTPDDLQFFYTNAGAVRQVGYSAQELTHMTVLDLKPEYDETRFRQLIAPLIRAERDSITFETVHRHKDGSLIPVEIFLQYIAPENDRGRFVAIVRDISERKQVERELDQHRQHLEELVAARSATIREQVSIINQTHDSVVTTDLDGVVTSWNKGSERLFGIARDQAIGRHISFVYPEEEHEHLQQQVIEPLKARGEHETEVRMQRADGSEFFALLSLSMLFDDKGGAKGMVGYAVDITERKRREALLQATTTKLQESNRELESFCHTVSHDLRAPLRAIHGFSQVLSEDYEHQLDDEARDYLRRIRAGADNMGRIIDDLLELSRVARRELRFSQVDLSALAETVVSELREREPERDVQVDVQPGLTALGDEGLLHILMENLLGNAWKYTSRTQHAHLEFGVRESGSGPEFYVKDNGAGFDMRYADKLFGTFERLHQANDFPGTGIGLATVHRIVTRHGGSIRGEGQPGSGACFSFSLPREAPADRLHTA